MKRGCIVRVELPLNSPFGDSYHIITENMTFDQFCSACRLTGCIPHEIGAMETEYIPLTEVDRYFEVKEQ